MQVTLREILLVGAGGFAGSVCRFLLSMALLPFSMGAGLPVGTFTVNVVGSFLIGIFMALAGNGSVMLVLVTGFCGGFTTFSTFSAETLAMLRGGQVWAGVGYAAASALVCVVMVFAGMYVAGRFK